MAKTIFALFESLCPQEARMLPLTAAERKAFREGRMELAFADLKLISGMIVAEKRHQAEMSRA